MIKNIMHAFAQIRSNNSPNQDAGDTYICPMHPEVKSISPGKCPKCGMSLKRFDTTVDRAVKASDEEKPTQKHGCC